MAKRNQPIAAAIHGTDMPSGICLRFGSRKPKHVELPGSQDWSLEINDGLGMH